MREHAILALLLVTGALAGCIGGTDDAADVDPQTADTAEANLSTPRFEILPVEVVEIPATSDGKAMNTAVYRPDTNGTVPVFINFSPYWGDGADERGDAFARYMISEYVPRGYAVVLASIRGTGHSEGCFQIGGDKEIADMHDVIDHYANVEWSNGKILAGGKSYDSTPQNGLIAKDPHPALEGLFHVSGITDMYRYTYRHGVPYSHGPIFNTYYYNQGISEYALPAPFTGANSGNASYEDEDTDSLARLVDDAVCPELPEEQAHGVGSGVHGMKTGYWTERDWNRYIADTEWNGSIFFVHGLQDWNVKPDHILPWLTKLPDQIKVKGWLHQDTQDSTGHVYPMRTDWNETMLAWMDHEVKGKDTGLSWGFEAEGSDDIWRASEAWPPAAVNRTTFEIELTDASTPTDPTNATGSLTLATPNGTPARLAGQPTLNITATSETADPVLTATLYEEDDGELTWINQAMLRGVYRDGLEQPTPVTPGEPVTYELVFYPQDDVIEPGNSLVLHLGGEPRYGVTTQAHTDAVSYDLGSATLNLPLAPSDTAVEPQPEDTICFAC